ncbi:uncharacterized protein SRS1_10118 [Sporisorium reilianum f. sp. reilianum]|uniref:Serine/threonine-protein phosphatase 4 regulatory subunit 2 n=1 Tax=Sporisorium reilianum f. sp. reilianum TaxID=72559 RepID=A0A2N8U5Z8_9BASI|nr:uncharacterized protein SRS1_10118 [Sporisorium reilianum f. sp. reilianum]
MTLTQPNDISPTFEWKPEYLAQLQHIADTDEFQSHDDHHPPPSSIPSGTYDWTLLKEAIKYRIQECLREEFGQAQGARGLDLHPAAALMPWVEPGSDMEVTWHRANMGLLCAEVEGDGEEVGKAEKAEQGSQAAGGDEAMTSEAEVATSATAASAAAETDTAPTEPATDHAQTNGTSATATDDDSPSETQYTYLSRFHSNPEHHNRTFTHPPFVHRADVQNFYPSKRPPSSTPAALTPAERTTYTSTLFSMLEDFDVQPPFTIQRLCELVVAPTAHYSTAHKWVAALKRCLSVTATRDAFPISPVQAPVGVVGVNGHSEDEVAVSEVDMDRMDGLPPATRSRSASVGSNASAEPLFSPIPFILRDENGRQSGEGDHVVVTDQIPDLEPGSADRTHAAEALPKEVVDVAPPAATAHDDEKENSEPMQQDSPAQPTAAASADTVAAAVEASTSSAPAPAPATAGVAAASEPQGLLPAGAVDELDNPTQTVNPLTATTTTTSETQPAAAQQSGAQTEPRQEEEESGEPEDAQRSSKRRKSVASLHDE